MGIFGSRRRWESLPADEIAAQMQELHENGKAGEAQKMLREIKRGKVPGVSPKEQKEMEKFYKRVTEGEKGIKAARASLAELKKLGKQNGNNGYGNRPLSQRVHPSKLKEEIRRGRYTPTVQEAANIKKNDPALYQQLLQQEAKRRGLL